MASKKRALVTGVAGQDGSYLAELLLGKGYEVFGLEHSPESRRSPNLSAVAKKIRFVAGDLLDQASLVRAVREARPHEIYNLGAQSVAHISSWEQPVYTLEVTGIGAARLLEAVRSVRPEARYFQACSSEVYGNPSASPQSESTPFHPRNPYGVAKEVAFNLVANYRAAYGMFAASGILFNHESPRRPTSLVSRKITNAAARIKLGLQQDLLLGNLDARRDWGFAGDYVECMWLVLQHRQPLDFVIASGQQHSVRELVELAFSHVGLDWRRYVKVSKQFYRAADNDAICGDPSRARRLLGWKPRTSFASLVRSMVDHDLESSQVGQR